MRLLKYMNVCELQKGVSFKSFKRVGTITGLDYWTGQVDWTTDLTQNTFIVVSR